MILHHFAEFFCSLRRDPDANKWPHSRQPLCIHLMSNTMRTLDTAMQMWDSRTSRSYLCSLDWSDTCLKASAQSPTTLELIFLSHDQGGPTGWARPHCRGGAALQVALRLSYTDIFIFFSKNAATAFSKVVTASAGDVVIHPDVGDSSEVAGADAWTPVRAAQCIKAGVIRVEAGWLQDVLMGSVLATTALGVLMLIDFFFSSFFPSLVMGHLR